MHSANPKMLVIARESRGLTQADLAKELNTAQGTISKVENGQLPASPDLVEQYAKLLKYPHRFFFREDEFRCLPVVYFRKRKSVNARDFHRIQAISNIVRCNMRAVMAHARPPEPVLPTVNLEKAKSTPEHVAQELRIRWHIPSGAIDNLSRLMEDNGILILRHDFDDAKIDALSIWEPKENVPPFVLINMRIPGDRYRFTLAHELAHLIFHHHLGLPGDECEVEADRFAAEFLVPTRDVRGHLSRITLDSLASLKRYWKVSMQSLVMKAASTGQITQKQKSRLMIQLSSLGYRTAEPEPIPQEEPTLASELFGYLVNVRGFNDSKLEELLDIYPEDFHKKYPIPAPAGLRLIKGGVMP